MKHIVPLLLLFGISFILFFTNMESLQNINISPTALMKYSEHNINKDETIVLLHGVPTSESLFDKMLPLLSDYRVIIPHMYGKTFGQQPLNDAQAIIYLLQEKEISNAQFVAHDRGGIVLWEILIEKPELANKLVILDTIGSVFPAPFEQDMVAPMLIPVMYSDFISGGAVTKQTLSAGGITDATLQEKIKSDQTDAGYDHLRYFFTNFESLFDRFDKYIAGMQSYSGKVHVLWGMNDSFLDSEIHLNALIDNFSLADENITRIEDAPHYIPVTHPEIVAEIINKKI